MSFSNHSDQELFGLVRDGDSKALHYIMLRYWEPVFHMTMKTLQDTMIAEDVVQDVFISIWEKRSHINLRYSLKGYLFACARYEIYRQAKKALYRKEQFDPEVSDFVEYFNPLRQLEYNELLEEVEELVGKLPEKCKEIYRLSRHDQLSHKEIASLLNVSTKTVENQITIALKHIRKGLIKMFILIF